MKLSSFPKISSEIQVVLVFLVSFHVQINIIQVEINACNQGNSVVGKVTPFVDNSDLTGSPEHLRAAEIVELCSSTVSFHRKYSHIRFARSLLGTYFDF